MGEFVFPGEVEKVEKEVAREVNPESDVSYEDVPRDNSNILIML